MSHEKQPTPEERFFIHLGEMKINFDNLSGFAFTHKKKKYDHLYVLLKGTLDEPEETLWVFRKVFESYGVEFDDVTQSMAEEGFGVIPQGQPTESDMKAYEAWRAKKQPDKPIRIIPPDAQEAPSEPSKELVHVPTPQAPELTEYGGTKERRIELNAEFIAYLIETNRGHLL
jgi:hypothetical protein